MKLLRGKTFISDVHAFVYVSSLIRTRITVTDIYIYCRQVYHLWVGTLHYSGFKINGRFPYEGWAELTNCGREGVGLLVQGKKPMWRLEEGQIKGFLDVKGPQRV